MKLDRERLQQAREQLGYGIEKTAEEAGVSKNSVLRAEHEQDIRPVTARKIAQALGVPVAELLPKVIAPKSPREWLRAHNALLLSLTEEGLSDQFRALYSDERVKFADRINREWQAVEMARDLAEDPNDRVVHDAYVHATSRYLQATTLAPISTAYDPDDPEKPLQVTLPFEKPETPARSGREGRDDSE